MITERKPKSPKPTGGVKKPGDKVVKKPTTGGTKPGDKVVKKPTGGTKPQGGTKPGDKVVKKPTTGGTKPGDKVVKKPSTGGTKPGDKVVKKPTGGTKPQGGTKPGDKVVGKPPQGGTKPPKGGTKPGTTTTQTAMGNGQIKTTETSITADGTKTVRTETPIGNGQIRVTQSSSGGNSEVASTWIEKDPNAQKKINDDRDKSVADKIKEGRDKERREKELAEKIAENQGKGKPSIPDFPIRPRVVPDRPTPRPNRPRPTVVVREPEVRTKSNSTTTSTKSNKVPTKKFADTVANFVTKALNCSTEEHEAALQVSQQQAQKDLGTLIGDLGTLPFNPPNNNPVADLIKEAQDAANDGKPLREGWETDLNAAIAAHPNANTVQPTLAGSLTGFVNSQNVHAVLAGGCDPNCNIFPTGMCECIMMPCLPTDDFCWVRENCCMVGTGGEGNMGVVNCDANELIDEPMGVGEPVAETTMDFENAADSGVLIINPEENDTEVSFVLEGRSYTLQPGYHQNFTDGDSWEVRFDKGGSRGDARYSIEPGTYVFTPEDGGWNLYRRTIEVSIENSGDSEFNYVVGDEQQTLKSGEAVEHSSDYPLFIRFDRGDGEDSVKRLVEKKTELAVALDPKKGQFDLFPADQVATSDSVSNETIGGSSNTRVGLLQNAKAETTDLKSGSRSSRLLALMSAKAKSKSP